MLVVSRKKEEKVLVDLPEGGTATVTICNVGRGRVKIGLEFPETYRIHRDDAASQQPKAA